MTASTLTHIPLAAVGALASAAGRAGLWAISQYARAPLAWTCGIAMVSFSVIASSNALYFQPSRHPAPLFAPAQEVPVAEPAPARQPQVIPAVEQTQPMPAPVSPQTTASVPASVPDSGPTGNAEVYELQKKLLALKLFEGTVDGYYGPMTARAIRAFELQAGLTPQGAMTAAVVDAIMRAPVAEPIVMRQPAAEPSVTTAAAQPQSLGQTRVAAAPQAAQSPQQAVAPQQPSVQPQVMAQTTPPPPSGQALPRPATVASPEIVAVPVRQGPEETFDAAADTVAGALDNLVAGIQDVAQPVVDNSRRLNPQAGQQAAPVQVATAPNLAPPAQVAPVSSTDRELVSKVQRGLASLGFLAGSVDGVAGEATARAIRNFEVYYNYQVTGRVTPELVDMLTAAGAVI